MSAILELNNVRAAYGPSQVIHGIDLAVAKGGITALLGANGAGKTTILRAICNMRVRVEGGIRFGGRHIDGWQTEDIVRLGIGHVPDGRGTFVHLTVAENLRERLAQQAGTLSGGEQQMLAIARALMLSPKLLLLDEPSFGLAPMIVQEIFRILRRINEDDGVSVLLVEQNASMALSLASQVYLLETGRIVLNGPAKLVTGNDRVRRAYLGY
jgi:branched-chain amino acid transport system ATP-binding protein